MEVKNPSFETPKDTVTVEISIKIYKEILISTLTITYWKQVCRQPCKSWPAQKYPFLPAFHVPSCSFVLVVSALLLHRKYIGPKERKEDYLIALTLRISYLSELILTEPLRYTLWTLLLILSLSLSLCSLSTYTSQPRIYLYFIRDLRSIY